MNSQPASDTVASPDAVSTLVRRAQAVGLDVDELSGDIRAQYQHAVDQALALTNSSLQRQIAYLVEQFGAEAVSDWMDRVETRVTGIPTS